MKQEIHISEEDRPRIDKALNLVERVVKLIEDAYMTYKKGAKSGK